MLVLTMCTTDFIPSVCYYSRPLKDNSDSLGLLWRGKEVLLARLSMGQALLVTWNLGLCAH